MTKEWWCYLGGVAHGAVVGLLILIYPSSPPPTSIPIELSAAERSQDVVIDRTRPITIRLDILSRTQFAAARSHPNVKAFAVITGTPCRVVLQEGMLIALFPSLGAARFANDDDAWTIAHEIMHCLRGEWHRPWTPNELGIAGR